jgi:o-succinylbenzoate---CoA ligase
MKNNVLHLNFGNIYRNETLITEYESKLSSSVPEWQKDVYRFILQWLDPVDHITVKTSGSTGEPQKIILKREWMLYSALQTCRFFNLNVSSTALLCMPAAYIAGKMMIVRGFASKLNLICTEPSANPFADLETVIDFAAITPYQLYASLETLKTAPVKTIIVGGGEISDSMNRKIQDLPVNIFATYGMTETSSHIAIRKVNTPDKDDYFTVIGETAITSDPRGCLVLENPDLFEGTLITNDLVEIADKNRFRWLGRFDNIINSGGIKIIPEAIEITISNLRKEKMIITSLKDDQLGEKVVLAIETDQMNDDEKTELIQKIKQQVPIYSDPRKVFAVKELPLTPNGKPNRIRLKEIISEMYRNEKIGF